MWWLLKNATATRCSSVVGGRTRIGILLRRQQSLRVTNTANFSSTTTQQQQQSFQLHPTFLLLYRLQRPKFGWNGLGELVYRRTYSRKNPVTGQSEEWSDTVQRVVEGCFTMQLRHAINHGLPFNHRLARIEAEDMYHRIFHMKFLPPGRGLWSMGSSLTMSPDRPLFAALNNCAFVSTQDLAHTMEEPFCFLMDAAMLGVGVGFDTKGAGTVQLHRPSLPSVTFVIPDSREGWVESVRLLLRSWLRGPNQPVVQFDYSQIRKKGLPIKGFGGVASGPGPLRELHESIVRVFESSSSSSPHATNPSTLSIAGIVDLMNLIGKCVVSGNVRRTAEIAFGDPSSAEYVALKNYKINPHRAAFGWTSNNSVFARIGQDYSPLVQHIADNGEPGIAWLENMQQFGRMNGIPDARDFRALGGNPCLEQTLESYELCCLVETFPDRASSLKDYLCTLRSAFLYAKTVTLGEVHWDQSREVMNRNRRIGCSMTGIAQFLSSRENGLGQLKTWCETGYQYIQQCDEEFSSRWAIPRSIKTTCIKPSGTVSLLAGSTPGMHFPESRFYIRRVRLPADSPLVDDMKRLGYDVEDDVVDPGNTRIVSVPVDAGAKCKTLKTVGLWEQLSLAAFLQRYWADNQVSCTATFDPAKDDLVAALDHFQFQLKGVSFLPKHKVTLLPDKPKYAATAARLSAMSKPPTPYAQMPMEEISRHEYMILVQRLRAAQNHKDDTVEEHETWFDAGAEKLENKNKGEDEFFTAVRRGDNRQLFNFQTPDEIDLKKYFWNVVKDDEIMVETKDDADFFVQSKIMIPGHDDHRKETFKLVEELLAEDEGGDKAVQVLDEEMKSACEALGRMKVGEEEDEDMRILSVLGMAPKIVAAAAAASGVPLAVPLARKAPKSVVVPAAPVVASVVAPVVAPVTPTLAVSSAPLSVPPPPPPLSPEIRPPATPRLSSDEMVAENIKAQLIALDDEHNNNHDSIDESLNLQNLPDSFCEGPKCS